MNTIGQYIVFVLSLVLVVWLASFVLGIARHLNWIGDPTFLVGYISGFSAVLIQILGDYQRAGELLGNNQRNS